MKDPQGMWALDGSDFPKQGMESAGEARQYCGALGKIANCQAGVFLAHVGPKGRALLDKRLYLPEEWTGDADRCAAAGYQRGDGSTEARRSWPWRCGASPGPRAPQVPVGRRRFRIRDVAHVAGRLGGGRDAVRFGRASGYDGMAIGTDLDQTVLLGGGRPRKPGLRRKERLTV